MHRVTRLLFCCVAAVALVCVGVVGQQALSAGGSLAQWLRDPFRLATQARASGPVVVERVQRLGRLETCRYQEQVVVRGETKGWLPVWAAGDRLLFLGRGEVVAGVDLSRLDAADVRTEGDTVAVRLPRSEILHARLDNRQSEVVHRRAGLFTGPDRELETKVRLEAEERLREAAASSGILATADANARDLMRRHLSLLGFRRVEFL